MKYFIIAALSIIAIGIAVISIAVITAFFLELNEDDDTLAGTNLTKESLDNVLSITIDPIVVAVAAVSIVTFLLMIRIR